MAVAKIPLPRPSEGWDRGRKRREGAWLGLVEELGHDVRAV